MDQVDLLKMDASSLSDLIREGSASVVDVAKAVIAQIETKDPDIRAFLHFDAKALLEQAERIDQRITSKGPSGRLLGVPVALKDNMVTSNMPTTAASKILEGWMPPYDATVVKKIVDEGALVVGKTNLDEFAMGSSTENSAFQTTRNPHDLSRVPGGSSGGSAAAVAAGMSTLSLGSDTGGSIRQPAALCGVVGVKPTYGYVSRYGLIAFASSLDQIGPFARTVGDAALLLEVISGHDPMDATSIRGERPSLSDLSDKGVETLRIGVLSELLDNCSQEVRERVELAAQLLAERGAKVETVSAKAVTLGLSAYYVIAPAEASSNLSRYDGVRFGLRADGSSLSEMFLATRTDGFGDEVKRRIMLGTYALSSGYYDQFYSKALATRDLIRSEFERVYRDFDILLGPTSPTTAFRVGEKAQDPMAMYMNDVCTIPSNLAGHPAMSVPFGTDSSGLPIGVQLLGPMMSEPVLFQVAFEVERLASEVSEVKDA